MEKSSGNFTIGSLAIAAGVNIETIRFYQRKGLMSEPPRPYGSIRRYTDIDMARICFIKASQRLGFSLKDIGELLKLEDGTHCNEVRERAEQKLNDVRDKLTDLHKIETILSRLVNSCDSANGTMKCPLISSLQHY